MWNGTAAILKPNPTIKSARPASNITLGLPMMLICPPIRPRFVAPVAPYASAMPYSRNPEANAPSRKYLSAASADRARRRGQSREHVHRDRHQLESQEDHHQIGAGGHHHHAEGP